MSSVIVLDSSDEDEGPAAKRQAPNKPHSQVLPTSLIKAPLQNPLQLPTQVMAAAQNNPQKIKINQKNMMPLNNNLTVVSNHATVSSNSIVYKNSLVITPINSQQKGATTIRDAIGGDNDGGGSAAGVGGMVNVKNALFNSIKKTNTQVPGTTITATPIAANASMANVKGIQPQQVVNSIQITKLPQMPPLQPAPHLRKRKSPTPTQPTSQLQVQPNLLQQQTSSQLQMQPQQQKAQQQKAQLQLQQKQQAQLQLQQLQNQQKQIQNQVILPQQTQQQKPQQHQQHQIQVAKQQQQKVAKIQQIPPPQLGQIQVHKSQQSPIQLPQKPQQIQIQKPQQNQSQIQKSQKSQIQTQKPQQSQMLKQQQQPQAQQQQQQQQQQIATIEKGVIKIKNRVGQQPQMMQSQQQNANLKQQLQQPQVTDPLALTPNLNPKQQNQQQQKVQSQQPNQNLKQQLPTTNQTQSQNQLQKQQQHPQQVQLQQNAQKQQQQQQIQQQQLQQKLAQQLQQQIQEQQMQLQKQQQKQQKKQQKLQQQQNEQQRLQQEKERLQQQRLQQQERLVQEQNRLRQQEEQQRLQQEQQQIQEQKQRLQQEQKQLEKRQQQQEQQKRLQQQLQKLEKQQRVQKAQQQLQPPPHQRRSSPQLKANPITARRLSTPVIPTSFFPMLNAVHSIQTDAVPPLQLLASPTNSPQASPKGKKSQSPTPNNTTTNKPELSPISNPLNFNNNNNNTSVNNNNVVSKSSLTVKSQSDVYSSPAVAISAVSALNSSNVVPSPVPSPNIKTPPIISPATLDVNLKKSNKKRVKPTQVLREQDEIWQQQKQILQQKSQTRNLTDDGVEILQSNSPKSQTSSRSNTPNSSRSKTNTPQPIPSPQIPLPSGMNLMHPQFPHQLLQQQAKQKFPNHTQTSSQVPAPLYPMSPQSQNLPLALMQQQLLQLQQYQNIQRMPHLASLPPYPNFQNLPGLPPHLANMPQLPHIPPLSQVPNYPFPNYPLLQQPSTSSRQRTRIENRRMSMVDHLLDPKYKQDLREPSKVPNNHETAPPHPSTSSSPKVNGGNESSNKLSTAKNKGEVAGALPKLSKTKACDTDDKPASKSSQQGDSNEDDVKSVKSAEETPKTENERPPLRPEYADLLVACREADPSNDMERLINSKLLRYYYSVHPGFTKSKGFRRNLKNCAERIRQQPDLVYYHLKAIIEELKVRRKSKEKTEFEAKDEDEEVVSETTTGNKHTDHQIKKLNKALCIVTKRIEALEEAEVDLDDEDSTYLQVERYKKRACQIYEKICDLTGESKNALRSVKKPIHFDGTEYPQFNKTLQAFVNRTKEFPDYNDVLRMMEHCNQHYQLGLLNFEVKRISEDAFLQVGKLLQSRRKTDLYETVSHFTANTKDPAVEDPTLLAKLSENKKHQKKISDVLEKYAREQEQKLKANRLEKEALASADVPSTSKGITHTETKGLKRKKLNAKSNEEQGNEDNDVDDDEDDEEDEEEEEDEDEEDDEEENDLNEEVEILISDDDSENESEDEEKSRSASALTTTDTVSTLESASNDAASISTTRSSPSLNQKAKSLKETSLPDSFATSSSPSALSSIVTSFSSKNEQPSTSKSALAKNSSNVQSKKNVEKAEPQPVKRVEAKKDFLNVMKKQDNINQEKEDRNKLWRESFQLNNEKQQKADKIFEKQNLKPQQAKVVTPQQINKPELKTNQQKLEKQTQQLKHINHQNQQNLMQMPKLSPLTVQTVQRKQLPSQLSSPSQLTTVQPRLVTSNQSGISPVTTQSNPKAQVIPMQQLQVINQKLLPNNVCDNSNKSLINNIGRGKTGNLNETSENLCRIVGKANENNTTQTKGPRYFKVTNGTIAPISKDTIIKTTPITSLSQLTGTTAIPAKCINTASVSRTTNITSGTPTKITLTRTTPIPVAIQAASPSSIASTTIKKTTTTPTGSAVSATASPVLKVMSVSTLNKSLDQTPKQSPSVAFRKAVTLSNAQLMQKTPILKRSATPTEIREASSNSSLPKPKILRRSMSISSSPFLNQQQNSKSMTEIVISDDES